MYVWQEIHPQELGDFLAFTFFFFLSVTEEKEICRTLSVTSSSCTANEPTCLLGTASLDTFPFGHLVHPCGSSSGSA